MSRGTYLTELRRSNASGTHGHRRPRAIEEDEAILESVNSNGVVLDRSGIRMDTKGEVLVTFASPDDELYLSDIGPTDEDLIAIDHEYDENLSLYGDGFFDDEYEYEY